MQYSARRTKLFGNLGCGMVLLSLLIFAAPASAVPLLIQEWGFSVSNIEITVSDVTVKTGASTSMSVTFEMVTGREHAGKGTAKEVFLPILALEYDSFPLDANDSFKAYYVPGSGALRPIYATFIPAGSDESELVDGDPLTPGYQVHTPAIEGKIPFVVTAADFSDGWFDDDLELMWSVYDEASNTMKSSRSIDVDYDSGNPVGATEGKALRHDLLTNAMGKSVFQDVKVTSDDDKEEAKLSFYNDSQATETFDVTFTQLGDYAVSLSSAVVAVAAGEYGAVTVTADRSGSRHAQSLVDLEIVSRDSSQSYGAPISFKFPGFGEPSRYLFPMVRTLSSQPIAYVGATNDSDSSVTVRLLPYKKDGTRYLDGGSPAEKSVTIPAHGTYLDTLVGMFPNVSFDADGQNPVLVEVTSGAGKITPFGANLNPATSAHFWGKVPVTPVSGSVLQFPRFTEISGGFDTSIGLTNTNPDRSITVDVELYDAAGVRIGTTTASYTVAAHNAVMTSLAQILIDSGASGAQGVGTVTMRTQNGERSLTSVLYMHYQGNDAYDSFTGVVAEGEEEL